MAIGETVLGAVLQVVFDRLASREVISFFRRSKFDQSLVHKLKTLMLAAEKLLLDAEEKQMTDSAVKLWLEELKHWFYRAEEVANQIAAESLQSLLEMELPSQPQSIGTKVRNLIPAFSSSSSFHNTATMSIREIVGVLESMLNQKDALGLRELSIGRPPQRVPTSSLLEHSEVYGRDKEKEKILELLLSGGNGISVVAIVGMGGLGKTTLAKMLYNDARVQETFDPIVWVCVSDRFDITQVTRSVLESVTNESCYGFSDLNLLQNKLSRELRNKRFLFVLDDVWNEKYEDWEILRAPFCSGANGSKIIVTTRNEGVASTMRTEAPWLLKPLSDEDAWSLFSTHALALGNLMSNPILEDMGRRIVHKCRGLPLAIKTLGGLLRCTFNSEDWKAVLHSSLWDLPNDKSGVIPALWLSYYHLPGHLKRCFAYCSIFPKGYRIDRKQLVLLWMAENFVLLANSKRIEDVAEEYLSQLLSRSFLEPIGKTHVRMHDLMHDLAQGISGNFLARHECQSTSKVYDSTRYFSYMADVHDVMTKFEVIRETKFLRTFLQLRANVRSSYLTSEVPKLLKPSLSCLGALSLSGYQNLNLTELSECPKQLRYLDVSNTTIRLLPEWVSNLYNLQSLILSYCRCLERLPADMWKLVSLRHLDIRGATLLSYMPNHMSKLTSLQTLTDFIVGKNIGSGIQELRELQQIRGKFSIRRLQNVIRPIDAYAIDMTRRKFIDDLELEFDSKENHDSKKDRELLKCLQPSYDVERLAIRNYGGTTFPKWLDIDCADYKKITFLCLTNCRYCITLPPLGQLPSLKNLKIGEMDYIIKVGHEFYGHNRYGPFPLLESLCFKDMKGWEFWSNVDVEGWVVSFPCLKRLYLCNCPKLKGDLRIHVPLLKEVRIDGCNELRGLLPQESSVDTLEVTSSLHVELASVLYVNSITIIRLVQLSPLENLPSELVKLSSLKYLSIQRCDNLKSLANGQLPPMVRFLEIKDCEVLESLPKGMEFLTHLRELKLSRCQHLMNAGNSLPTSLTRLFVSDCQRWEFPIPMERMQNYMSLEAIRFHHMGSHSLVSFPLGIFPTLRTLEFKDCRGLREVYIPEGIVDNSLESLSSLDIKECRQLKMIGKETGRGEATVLPTPNLRWLNISHCEKAKPVLTVMEGEVLLPELGVLTIDKSRNITSDLAPNLRRSLLRFSSLRRLVISDEEVECFPASDEGWGCLPTSLTELSIRNFPKLRKVDGKAFQHLKYLQKFSIYNCPSLERLPEEGLPPSLGRLSIHGCPMVKERYPPDKGQDWPHIRHITHIRINSDDIQSP